MNADDFGRSAGVNRGVVDAFEHGIVTSASLMVRWPAATEAARYARRRGELSVGLHVDLSEWEQRDSRWIAVYDFAGGDDPRRIEAEIHAQLDVFRALMDSEPTHLDSHQHVHLQEPARSVLRRLALELEVPLRHETPAIEYRGDFYGQTSEGEAIPDAISVDRLIGIAETLRPGITELGCHPGYAADLDSTYRAERDEEVRVLCDARVRRALDDLKIELCAFHTIPAGAGSVGARPEREA